ncbi:NAD(P)-dependent oxidoreductase [Sinorhizobium meliloti]|uniref:NAD(P)H-dependent oxidoreductase n=1 Tax=Rhizobium meliloti TaxID=382 RepID=UPI000FD90EE1|nr:Gfo/Idh/MocA family oxidoreductase [Sinorhizobium meliloti]MDE3801457.1 NAD(P)-dependent oxidoreductase [Sinorhizobium meliloti]MDW9366810.1 NAD(P)-dependent oxidoreductase [Sinorhizobium meliloti]MDW9407031.1 NAD(P)-dependent oxidoreductase [Sinorhizobium meliloti]MDW9428156.1 NAD(P)-dependent oxidoreductase [Sinorhizobium meliloti]MDW9452237.1 NAD(P)-dependent oxidoreductase [Sinorhizobium meliloti]
MFIVDRELERLQAEGRPIRVGMVGAGFMARGIARQMLRHVPGMELVAISNRRVEKARDAYAAAGEDDVTEATSTKALEDLVARGRRAITADPMHICEADGIDVVVEATGAIEFAAHVTMRAIGNGKHVALMNAEVDSTIGPIMKVYADRAGVVLTNVEGDQPGVIINLYRWVKGLGIRPVLCGNIKGLHDPYRNPTTQEGFAKKWGMKAPMVTSFADGTKISFENAIVANATGMRVAKRGMYGPVVASGTPIQEAVGWYPLHQLLEGPGIVDYCVGAMPNPGIFVLGTTVDAVDKHYLSLYKMGPGPLYCFYWPYHLCHFEVPSTVARAAIFRDAAITPLGTPAVDVVAAAKRDLSAGEVLDGLGHYMTYGLCENAQKVHAERLVPIGLAEGCRLLRDVKRDEVLGYDDIELPVGRLCDALRREQDLAFFGRSAASLRREVSATA